MRSVMSHNFSKAATINAPRSQFDRSRGYKTAFDAGNLIPFFFDEVLPGDTYNVKAAAFARMATPEFPIMDNLKMDTHWFFVPLRLLQTNFVKLMGEQDNPDDSIDYLTPIVVNPYGTGGFGELSLYDYLAIPTKVTGGEFDVVNYHDRAYNLIWNYWFRSEYL